MIYPPFLALLLLSLILRVFLTPLAVHGDLIIQSGWGLWLSTHGPYGFYENNVWIYGWPNHPPLISLIYGFAFKLNDFLNTFFVAISTFIATHHLGAAHLKWWFDFVKWFGKESYYGTPFKIGQFISLKLVMIISDLVLGGIIYHLARGKFSQKKATAFSALYLLSPFSFYLSSSWGQSDQLGFLFLFMSFILLVKNKSYLAPLIFICSALLKPTSLIFLPLFIWVSLQKKPNIKSLIGGLVLVLISLFLTLKIFSWEDPYHFGNLVIHAMFDKGEVWTWVSAFNFWRIITPELTPHATKFLFLSLNFWGYLLFGLGNLIAFYLDRSRNFLDTVISLFIVSFSGFLFITAMHERYFFTSIATGLILAIYYPKILKYWLVISLIYFINLYHGWWYPDWLDPLRQVLVWQGGVITKALSLVNLLVFFKLITLIKPNLLRLLTKKG